MIRTILSLGKTPLSRRIFAGFIIVTTAIVVSLLRNKGAILALDLAPNIIIAGIAFGLLHLRWRKQERRDLTPKKIKDTFS